MIRLMYTVLFLLATIVLVTASTVTDNPDQVLILPGLRHQPTFKHFSGYLNGSATARLHYWLVESQHNPQTDPLVLWLNGGPGCSSLDGLLTEHGPFRISDDGFLTYNPHSWNTIANVVYLESPSCVGFSYDTSKNCSASDDLTSLLNLNALHNLLEKFPQYKNRDFYITGESYAGYYIPTLSVRILESNPKLQVNFKGIAVGNGLNGWNVNNNGNLNFAYNHGLVSDSLWSEILKECCGSIAARDCDIVGNNKTSCSQLVSEASSQFKNINVYNIYSQCLSDSSSSSTKVRELIWKRLGVSSNYEKTLISQGWHSRTNPNRISSLREIYKIMTFVASGLGALKQSMQIPCISSSASRNYLNNGLVRFALHIPHAVQNWTVCSSIVNLNYKSNYVDMSGQYKKLFANPSLRIWIYNGDVDMACSYLADEWFFEKQSRKVLQQRREWIYDAGPKTSEAKETNHQVGGYIKVWDRFVLLTVHGAGHMVPTDRPMAALTMFRGFLNNKIL